MKKVTLSIPLLLGALMVTGCTDAEIGKFNSLGLKKEVTCYSGGKMIYKGVSSGKVQSEKNSDGYYFTPEGSKTSVEISGDCTLLPVGVSNGL